MSWLIYGAWDFVEVGFQECVCVEYILSLVPSSFSFLTVWGQVAFPVHNLQYISMCLTLYFPSAQAHRDRAKCPQLKGLKT